MMAWKTGAVERWRSSSDLGRGALGARAGARVRRRGDSLAAVTEPPGLGPCHARHNGFDLHAGLCVPPDHRDRLERICRYALRPPVAQERLHVTDAGQVQLELRRPWADGTTHLLFDPVGLLERLAALTPRPRINLILYHGVLGPRAAWRSLVVQFRVLLLTGVSNTAYNLASLHMHVVPKWIWWLGVLVGALMWCGNLVGLLEIEIGIILPRRALYGGAAGAFFVWLVAMGVVFLRPRAPVR